MSLILGGIAITGIAWVFNFGLVLLKEFGVFKKILKMIKHFILWEFEEVKVGWRNSLLVGELLITEPNFSIASFIKCVKTVFNAHKIRTVIRNITGYIFSIGVWGVLFGTFKIMVLCKKFATKKN